MSVLNVICRHGSRLTLLHGIDEYCDVHDSSLVANVVDSGQILQPKRDASQRHAACEQGENSSEGYPSDPVAAQRVTLPRSQHS